MHSVKKIFLFFLIYSFIIMLFCTYSSPLMGNLYVDSSVFFTIGRGMKAGLVAYRDLFDHKGWYLYFFNYLAACISDKNTVGLYVVETLFVFADLVLGFLIAYRYLDRKRSVLFSLFMSAILLNYFTHEAGNVTEFYAVTFIFLSIYLVVLYDRDPSMAHPASYMLIHGINAGVCFFLRPNMVVMFGAVPVVVLLGLLRDKRYKDAFRNVLGGAAGLGLAFAPPLLYALIFKCLPDMFFQMITFNLEYAGKTSVSEKLRNTFGTPVAIVVLFLLMASLVVVLRKCRVYLRIMYVLAVAFSLFAIALSGRKYGHYFEYVVPLFSPLVLWQCKKIPDAWAERVVQKRFITVAVVVAIAGITVIVNMRTPIKFLTKRRYYQRNEESKLMKETFDDRFGGKADVKVLALSNNASFYNELGVYPPIKYFYLPAVPYAVFPDAADSQFKAIMDGTFDVIITCYGNGGYYIFDNAEYDSNLYDYLQRKYDNIVDCETHQMWVRKD